MHNIHDMMQKVDMTKGLMQNRQNDMQIRRDNGRNQALSTYKKIEFAFNELYDLLENVKSQQLKEFETQAEEHMNNLV